MAIYLSLMKGTEKVTSTLKVSSAKELLKVLTEYIEELEKIRDEKH